MPIILADREVWHEALRRWRRDLPLPRFRMIFPSASGLMYDAIDNSTGDLWMESFVDLSDAIAWVNGDEEVP